MESYIPDSGNDVSVATVPHEPGGFVTGDERCPCCGRLHRTDLYDRHMAALDCLAGFCGFGIRIVSGYRCPEYNRAFGGTLNSWHLLFATDVAPVTGSGCNPERIYTLANEAGFGGVGLLTAEQCVHLDLRYPPFSWRV